MTENVEIVIFEHLKKIQAELSASRDRDREIMARLGQLETGVSRLVRDNAEAYGERVDDRHAFDALRLRVERIERRLEI